VFVATDSPDMIRLLEHEVPDVSWRHVPADRSQGSGSALMGQVSALSNNKTKLHVPNFTQLNCRTQLD